MNLSELTQDSSTFVFNGGIDEKETLELTTWLTNIYRDEAVIILTTTGGSINQAAVAYDAIRSVKATVHIVAMGIVASAGHILMCAVPKENRYAGESTHFMTHAVSSSCRRYVYPAQPERPDDETLLAMEAVTGHAHLDENYFLQEWCIGMMVRETNLDEATIRDEMYSPRGRYFSAREAVSYGYVAELLT